MTSTQSTPEVTPSALPAAICLGNEVDHQRERLLALRAELRLEQERAVSPAVARALEMAEIYLFLGLGYLGHTDELFPGELPPSVQP